MTQESNESVSYLVALKQSTSGGAAAAPARSVGSPGHVSTGLEKRRSPRYKCEGSAELRQEASDVRTWATFTDVSMHGCYVEAASTYPVGTVVHVKLEANTFQVQATGKVRVTYPSLGMGIAFTDVSEIDRARLKEL